MEIIGVWRRQQPRRLPPIPLWPGGVVRPRASPHEHEPYVTPYLAEAPSPVAAIVICPGGGYGMRAPHEGDPVARWLNGLGISAIVLHYRVAPHRHPAPLHDAQRALRLTRAEARAWRIDPARVGILGFSAGGHLASSAGTHFDSGDPAAPDPVRQESSRPDLMVLCYPVITFGPERHHGSMVNLLGEEPEPALRRDLSNETQVTNETPPTFLWHTADDAAVPVANSLLFAQAMASHGVPFELHVFPHGSHGLGLALDDPIVGTWTSLCAAWLRGQGFGRT